MPHGHDRQDHELLSNPNSLHDDPGMMGVRNASSGHSMPPSHSGGSQKRIKNRNEYGYDRIKLECARPQTWISTLGG